MESGETSTESLAAQEAGRAGKATQGPACSPGRSASTRLSSAPPSASTVPRMPHPSWTAEEVLDGDQI